MIFLVKCLNVDCPFHHIPGVYEDLGLAELVAFAHEQRQGQTHAVEVQDKRPLGFVPVVPPRPASSIPAAGEERVRGA